MYLQKSRRRQNQELANSQPTTPSRHFVPTVLQSAPIGTDRNTLGITYGTQSLDSIPSSPLDRDPEEALRFYQNIESRYEQV
jgi:hypothetical protein